MLQSQRRRGQNRLSRAFGVVPHPKSLGLAVPQAPTGPFLWLNIVLHFLSGATDGQQNRHRSRS
jgi:hypothetical protein